MLRVLHLILVVWVVTAHFAKGDIVIADPNMPSNEWTHSLTGSGSFASGSTIRNTPGIVGFPASHLTHLVGFSSTIGIHYRSFHFDTKASNTLNLATMGIPTSLSLDAWCSSQTGSVIFNAAIQQNGSVYVAQPFELAGVIGTQHYNRSIPISAFTLFQGGGPAQLNLTSSGGALNFGYVDYNDSGIRNSANSVVTLNDVQLSGFNMTVNVTAVPEPNSLLLIFASCFVAATGRSVYRRLSGFT